LIGPSLYYAEEPNDVEQKGVISLPTATAIGAVDGTKKRWKIAIVTPKRTYRLCADSEEDRATWLTAINLARGLPPEDLKSGHTILPIRHKAFGVSKVLTEGGFSGIVAYATHKKK